MPRILNFYMDDSGTRAPTRKPLPFNPRERNFFALGGVLINEEDEAPARNAYERCDRTCVRDRQGGLRGAEDRGIPLRRGLLFALCPAWPSGICRNPLRNSFQGEILTAGADCRPLSVAARSVGVW